MMIDHTLEHIVRQRIYTMMDNTITSTHIIIGIITKSILYDVVQCKKMVPAQ